MTTYFVNSLKIDGVLYKLSNEADDCIDEIRNYTYTYMTNTYNYVQDTYTYFTELGSNIDTKIDNTYSYTESSISYFDERISNFETSFNESTTSTLEGLNTKIENLSTEITNNFISKIELAECGYITSHQSLEDYATKEFVSTYVLDKLNGFEIPSLEGYASEEFVNTKISEINIPSLEGYASEDWVTEQLNNLNPTIDLSDYVTEEKLSTNLANYATQDWVSSELGKISNNIDLSNYVTKEENKIRYNILLENGDPNPAQKNLFTSVKDLLINMDLLIDNDDTYNGEVVYDVYKINDIINQNLSTDVILNSEETNISIIEVLKEAGILENDNDHPGFYIIHSIN